MIDEIDYFPKRERHNKKKKVDSAVVKLVDTARCLRVASCRREVSWFESKPQSQPFSLKE